MTYLYALALLWQKISPKTSYSACLLATKAILQEVSATILYVVVFVVAKFGLNLSTLFEQERAMAVQRLFPLGVFSTGSCIHGFSKNQMHTTPNLLDRNNVHPLIDQP